LLEQKFVGLQTERDSKAAQLDEERKKHAQLSLELNTYRQKANSLESNSQSRVHEVENLRLEVERLRKDKQAIVDVLAEKDTQISDIANAKQRQAEELHLCKNENKELREKVGQLENDRNEVVSEFERQKRKMDILEKDYAWTNEELAKKTDQANELRKTKDAHILELQVRKIR
jgi:chromosome segregation ATPase